MNTDTQTDVVSEELLDAEVPCGGIKHRKFTRSCDRAAVLQSRGHGCKPSSPAYFKCLSCWQAWYQILAASFARQGRIRCRCCKRLFDSIESFSDYRPF